ncbi:MAG: DUF368 domain-containing protein [Tenericutes bacterium]|nr:DUF368 domain-containing protein [Mycoplasmatota bacterium]
MSFIYIILCGLLIGSFMVMPGVSGLVIAVILGLYEKIISSATNLFKDFKNNFLFLLFLGIGVLIGCIWVSNILILFYEKYESITKLLFIGLILGGTPYLIKQINKPQKTKNILIILFTLLGSLSLFVLSKSILSFNLNVKTDNYLLSSICLFLSGFIYSIGKVIPGISSSFLLMIIGMYEYVLSVIAHPITVGLADIKNFIWFILGLFLGVIILLKTINNLLDKHHDIMYCIITGFVIGSLPILIPNNLDFNFMIGILFGVLGFIFTYKMSK